MLEPVISNRLLASIILLTALLMAALTSGRRSARQSPTTSFNPDGYSAI